jgi:hypothetical protein
MSQYMGQIASILRLRSQDMCVYIEQSPWVANTVCLALQLVLQLQQRPHAWPCHKTAQLWTRVMHSEYCDIHSHVRNATDKMAACNAPPVLYQTLSLQSFRRVFPPTINHSSQHLLQNKTRSVYELLCARHTRKHANRIPHACVHTCRGEVWRIMPGRSRVPVPMKSSNIFFHLRNPPSLNGPWGSFSL